MGLFGAYPNMFDPFSPTGLWLGYHSIPVSDEEVRAAHKRLGLMWLERSILRRFDRCCHGKSQ